MLRVCGCVWLHTPLKTGLLVRSRCVETMFRCVVALLQVGLCLRTTSLVVRVAALALMAQGAHRLDKEAAASMLEVCSQVSQSVPAAVPTQCPCEPTHASAADMLGCACTVCWQC